MSLQALGLILVWALSLMVLTFCTSIVVILFWRLWRDLRPSQSNKICGTLLAVFLWGTVSIMCGLGAYSLLTATTLALINMVTGS